MSITDELREYAVEHECDSYRKLLNAIADRIDAEHEKAIRELNNLADASVLLPVDADGVPIHVGDELTNGEDLPAKVLALILAGDGWWCRSGAASILAAQSDLRHVKPDSWESIMDDAEKLARRNNADVMELVERCRRLAGEGA